MPEIQLGTAQKISNIFLRKQFELRPPSLHVLEPGDVGAGWVVATTVDEPEDSLFAFRNELAGATWGVWQFGTAPMSPADHAMDVPGMLGSGTVVVPGEGTSKTFTLPWKQLVDARATDGATYFARVVVGRDAPAQSFASSTVRITVKKSTSNVKFTLKGLGLTTEQKHPHLYANPSLNVRVDLDELFIQHANEAADEPYLLVGVVWVDGTTINPLDMAGSTIRVDSPVRTHGNVPDEDAAGDDLESFSVVAIPDSTGRFQRTVTPIGLALAADMEDADGSLGAAIGDATSVYLVVVAMEEDITNTSAADAARDAFATTLKEEVEKIVHETTLASIKAGEPVLDQAGLDQMTSRIKDEAMGAAEDETLHAGWFLPGTAPLIILQGFDRDDVVGVAIRKFSYWDLIAQGTDGIEFALTANAPIAQPADWEGKYVIRGRVRTV